MARHAQGPIVCPRCQLQLAAAHTVNLGDAGIELDWFDASAKEDLTLPGDMLAEEESRQRLRRIGRQLRASSSYQKQRSSPTSFPAAPPAVLPEIQLKSVSRQAATAPRHHETSWQVSCLLLCGGIGFIAGVGVLAWSAAFQLAQLWQWGMAATIAAEGLLILGLTWMAARLWKNGRRINRQLSGFDRRLLDIQQQTGALAGSRLSASQQYYHHFNQVASPHHLLANLRGQVDQLASRIVADG